ncbi:MAG: chalcone isomerase family protein [Parasulfuritortus sp.]|nr:chalcone isomerase family protein [Parasulfuritortus sp.]
MILPRGFMDAIRIWPALFALMLGLSSPSIPAQSLQTGGVNLPDHASLGGHQLVLNGAGLRRLFGFRIYVAALYLPQPQHEAAQVLDHDEPRRLQLTLLRDITTDQNLDALKGGLVANNSPTEMEAIRLEVDHFLALVRQAHSIQAGTVMQLDYTPTAGTQLKIGNQELGTIPGERFNRDILKIWLGDDPIQSSLKKALLGQENS